MVTNCYCLFIENKVTKRNAIFFLYTFIKATSKLIKKSCLTRCNATAYNINYFDKLLNTFGYLV